MSDIAFQERDIININKKNRFNKFFLFTRKGFRKLFFKEKATVKKICIYPVINNIDDLSDLLNRISFSLPSSNIKIFISVSKELINIDISKLKIPEDQRNYLSENKLNFIFVSKSKIFKYFFTSQAILLWKIKYIYNPLLLLNYFKIEIIDKNYYSTEESKYWMRTYYSTLKKNEKQYHEELSKKNYLELLNKYKGYKKAYCFVTGPSFDKYKEFKFEKDSLKYACNSVVKNMDFFKYINGPEILAFSDPVFHFSPCKYAAKFRDNVIEVFNKYNCYIVVPDIIVPLLLNYYPEIKDKIIGLGISKEMNFPNPDNLTIKISGNVLTQYMLPIASFISDEIYILGADGRKKDEKYFWKHSSSVQYDDLMNTVFKTHPSFFRDRVYTDYYDKHCNFLNDLIEYGEKRGKKYFSLTPSYIDFLNKRYTGGKNDIKRKIKK